jgi:hypothetical protein
MKSSALRNALAAEELPASTSIEEYRQHMMKQLLVEPVEKEIHAIRVGFLGALGDAGVAILRKYHVTCDDLLDMVRLVLTPVCVGISVGISVGVIIVCVRACVRLLQRRKV